MTKLRLLPAVALLLPLIAFGTSVSPDASSSELAPAALPAAEMAVMDGQESYDCCWIFMMGRWWCVPC